MFYNVRERKSKRRRRRHLLFSRDNEQTACESRQEAPEARVCESDNRAEKQAAPEAAFAGRENGER